MPREISPAEIRDLVENTAVMDWQGWGPTLSTAVEEFSTAIAIGWPTRSAAAEVIRRNAASGRIDAEDAFGLLQDLVI